MIGTAALNISLNRNNIYIDHVSYICDEPSHQLLSSKIHQKIPSDHSVLYPVLCQRYLYRSDVLGGSNLTAWFYWKFSLRDYMCSKRSPGHRCWLALHFSPGMNILQWKQLGPVNKRPVVLIVIQRYNTHMADKLVLNITNINWRYGV